MAVFCLTFKRGSTVYKDVGIVTITTVTAANGIPARVYAVIPMFPPTEQLYSERLRGLPWATQARAGATWLQRLGWPSDSFLSQLTLTYLSHLQINCKQEKPKWDKTQGCPWQTAKGENSIKITTCVPGDA